ncbi:protein FAM8A1-like [Paramormyrops kingsleyae]|uniref:Family with sequence similarity 8 member A1b n=1 Tax=Paramormyrops kingsleyae TaxID=1676925 RepID=A0A3B3R2H7_9TELE|nr:protein FAM8A1-like [Paramormyrops kingsleyae]
MSESGFRLQNKEETVCDSTTRRRSAANIISPNPGVDKKTMDFRTDSGKKMTTTEYCRKLQEWMWQYYGGYASWLTWTAMSAFPLPSCAPASEAHVVPPWGAPQLSEARGLHGDQFSYLPPNQFVGIPSPGLQTGEVTAGGPPVPNTATAAPRPAQQQQQTNRNTQQAGREYTIPSPLQRFFAEMVDFFILFFIKATIILSVMHLSGIKDISKFAMHFIVEEIDQDTSMEDLQHMMLVALVYRVLVCLYEIICIWGAGGATPGKFLLGLRVVTCDTSVLVRPNRVLVVPASNVKFSASTVRALNKNFSIALFFPAFITLLFFQHNRTVYDIVAGTIVVKRGRAR